MFIELYTEYVLSKQALAGKTIDKITAQRYKTRLEEIKIFLVDVYKTSDMPISKPNIEFCQKYKNWLYQIRNNGEETVRKKIDVLIKVFDEAIKRDLITKNPAKFIEKERKKYDVPSKLTSEEIARLENLTFNKFNKRLESTRDCLLLSIYTGFGYAELKEFHLYENQEVLVKIRGKSSKLSKNVKHIIALYTPQIKAIIDKYSGMSNIPKIVKTYKSLKSDFEYIKELAELDKKLHLHLGRKTRANILVNGLKLSQAEASSFLGNTEKVFREHYAIVENSTLFSKLVSVQPKNKL
jgi:site-specific recombinase XerD